MKKSESENNKDNNKGKKREKYIAEKATVKKEKTKSSNIFTMISKYFRGVGTEIKRIRWTSGKELIKYSIASVAFVLFFGIYFYAIDWVALLVRSLAK